MPSLKKRINLTVPDSVYDRLQKYKQENGITNDASACLQLIIQQLKSQEESALMLQTIRRFTPEEVEMIATEGIRTIKKLADFQDEKQQ